MSPRCLMPVAGRGTRLRPITISVPKEMLPVGTRPMLQWAITEALEGGFTELGFVIRDGKPLLERYLEEEGWRQGLLPALTDAAGRAGVQIFRQDRPRGVVDAVLTASDWLADGPSAVLLPDNVRLAGSPPLSSASLGRAPKTGGLVACHRVGPERSAYYGDVGRIELEELVPAGRLPRVRWIQERGEGAVFETPPEGAWRLLPRWVVTGAWLEEALRVSRKARRDAREADDVDVHRRLVERGSLSALPWEGVMADAGSPRGFLHAQHLLHEAARAGEGEPDLLQVERR